MMRMRTLNREVGEGGWVGGVGEANEDGATDRTDGTDGWAMRGRREGGPPKAQEAQKKGGARRAGWRGADWRVEERVKSSATKRD